MNKWISGRTLIRGLEQWVPKSLAFEDDRVGVLVGTINRPLKKVMVTLDVLENVADEAAEEDVDLIVAHHPVIFHPLRHIFPDQGQGKIITKLIKNDIAVYAAHTNLDVAEGGVNDMLAERLSLERTSILKPTGREPLFKLVVYVPETHIESIRKVLGDSGAGFIGAYSHCTFTALGEGTFLPRAGTHPYIGQAGKLERVPEGRLETIVPEHRLEDVVRKMIDAHPYEEVAYDVYPLKNGGKAYGLGRIGGLSRPVSFRQLCEDVKQKLQLEGLRAVGPLDEEVRTVAVCGGDGNSLVPYAKTQGADVLITGDLYYHTAHDALLAGLKVIDAGHHIESIMKARVRDFLQDVVRQEGCDTEVIVSESKTDPFQFM